MNWYEKSKVCGRYRKFKNEEKLRIYEFRDNPTPAEKALWEIVGNNQIRNLRFRRQHKIGQFIVDFYCHKAGLVVEVDGGIHEKRKAEDSVRSGFLKSLGLAVLMFTNNEVLDNIGQVRKRIEDFITTMSNLPLSGNRGGRALDKSPPAPEGSATSNCPHRGPGGLMKKIQILGTGCPKCKKLFEAAQQAVKELGVEAEVTKVEDINEIMKFNVMMTPALAVDDVVKVSGRIPKPEEIKKMIS
ncbi:MAG: TM0996/MTH895 family glutaredoxin-like protein [Chitinispirillaceae bacterium]|nr:TM0996/MTH895 family glutaredoxin-like protein [Chitinispirillaceae bacterium]